ncbi:Alpha crystallin/Hsp20 domain - like 10 [Theobroma cacao]|uniref:18.1 kDa class I heat shock protein n=2 Tax=Theobroma cacao TaxID=3641 RepID=A0AB32V1M4_THECC|nr:PREDICTED: 18.1 kDa class I heat shock protein [Theobroma cacao]EOY07355.1 HSP20-like chaperones superfamily protein, putative [Theobroma cacao]WRX25234.1 Alpha crystallin/Hsp20 domain - like 10 [Theobroma cacao]
MSKVPNSYLHEPFYQQAWDPFQEFNFGGTLVAPRPAFSSGSPFALANLDWKETPEAHVLKADLPGLNRNEVKLELEDGRILCISGDKSSEKEVKSDNWHRVEWSSGSFVRRFRLPEDAKVDKLTAYLENGVLTVTVPKKEARKGNQKRTIQILG